jgi:DNA-binding CsgD family transcriptional regulator
VREGNGSTCPQQLAVAMLDVEERLVSVWGHVDHRLHVAVVHTDQAVRHGLTRLLERDPRLHLMDPVGRIAELRTAGLGFDVCVLGLPEAAAADEAIDLISGVPCIVWTSARHWRSWVAAWAWGARGVLGQDVGRVPMSDTVWDAVYSPHDIHPQLARALLAGIGASGLYASPELTDVLGRVAEGRRVPSALSVAGISPAAYVSDIAALRAACQRAGLGILQAVGGDREAGERRSFEPSVLPPEALMLSARVREVLRYYADGYGYEEIAELLNIGEATVKTHVLTAMDKFGITANRSSEVRLLFAIYISGRHRQADLVRRRLDILRRES